MENGAIVERGTYDELIAAEGTFARLVRDFGGKRDHESAGAVAGEKHLEVTDIKKPLEVEEKKPGLVLAEKNAIMTAETRNTGSISGQGECFVLAVEIHLLILRPQFISITFAQLVAKSYFQLSWVPSLPVKPAKLCLNSNSPGGKTIFLVVRALENLST